MEALNNVRVSAPKAYDAARKDAPGLFAVRAVRVSAKVELPKVDVGLQSAFHELAEAMREHLAPEEMHGVIAHGLQLVNAKYKAEVCAGCAGPDADGYAVGFRSLAAGSGCAVVGTGFAGGAGGSGDDCHAVEWDRRPVLARVLSGNCRATGRTAEPGGRSDGARGGGERRGGAGVRGKVSRFHVESKSKGKGLRGGGCCFPP